MRKLGAFEVKTHLSEILEQVHKGEEVLITKRGEPIALLIPYRQTHANVRTLINDFRQWRKNITWGKDISIKEAKNQGRR